MQQLHEVFFRERMHERRAQTAELPVGIAQLLQRFVGFAAFVHVQHDRDERPELLDHAQKIVLLHWFFLAVGRRASPPGTSLARARMIPSHLNWRNLRGRRDSWPPMNLFISPPSSSGAVTGGVNSRRSK